MLKGLRISNYALIDSLNFQPDRALNTITGETGAGKSIMLGALSLILGNRADLTILRNKDLKCVIEADFDLQELNLKTFFTEHDLDWEPITIIRREIIPSGKSRAFVNDTPVKLNVLRLLSEQLIDIHGQNQTQWLNDPYFQLSLVDGLAQNRLRRDEYYALFKSWKALDIQIQQWQELESKGRAELDYHQYLLTELAEAQLQEGEQKTIEEELSTLEHAEDIQRNLSESAQVIDEEESGISLLINNLKNSLNSASRWSEKYRSWTQRVESVQLEIEDLSFEINRELNSLEVDPQRIDRLNERLNQLNTLQKKHAVDSVETLIKKQAELSDLVQQSDSLSDQIQEGTKKLAQLRTQLDVKGRELSLSRREAEKPLKKQIEELLGRLGMPHAQLAIEWKELENPSSQGLEEIEFLFSANKGERLESLRKVASGGEMSRFMLGIKSMVAQYRKLPTILFDEIDTGVSGEIADRMGALMADMGERMQVICITHLPQVAAKGSLHFKVFKEELKDRTTTQIAPLNHLERVEEIAGMLSGEKKSEAARQTAKELIGI